MNIAFFEIDPWAKTYLKEHSPFKKAYFTTKDLAEHSLPKKRDFEAVCVFVDSEIGEKVLEAFPKLKFITTRSTGYDHIDLVAAKKRGVVVSRVADYGTNTVAEFTFGLMLNLTRKIYQSVDQIKETGSFSLEGLRGTDLKGKTLGVIGAGRIGKEVIAIARGFGMEVLAIDPFQDQKAAKKLGFKYVSLGKLLRSSDIITLHAAHTAGTHHIINKKNIKNMKKGVFLVNTARGELVETAALLQALEKGIVAGAALDVLEEEESIKEELEFFSKRRFHSEDLRLLVQNHILLKYPNVLVTPHNAFNSKEAMERIMEITIENIQAFAKGKPINVVG